MSSWTCAQSYPTKTRASWHQCLLYCHRDNRIINSTMRSSTPSDIPPALSMSCCPRLKRTSIQTLVDIRAFPVSRRLPHFNRESLEQSLEQNEIRYVWMKGLGGYRKKTLDDSPNPALRNQSFRNYADYMLTDEFNESITRLTRACFRIPHCLHVCGARLFPLPSHAGLRLVGSPRTQSSSHRRRRPAPYAQPDRRGQHGRQSTPVPRRPPLLATANHQLQTAD